MKVQIVKNTTPALFAELQKSPHKIASEMVRAAAGTFQKGMVDTIEKNGNVFEGTLKKSIKSKVARGSGNPKVVVGSFGVEYAKYIEFGRPAGTKFDKKEWGKLMKWVSRKLGVSGKANMKVAHSIRKKISEQGREAQPFVRTVAQSQERQFTNKLRMGVNRYMRSIKV